MATPMAALPAAPAPPRPRLLMIATALAVGAGTMLFGGLLGIYVNMREAAGGTTAEWVPSSITFPEIAVNTVAITLVCSVVIIHWALWAINNGDRRNTYIALGLTVVLGFASVNALAFSFNQMHLAVRDNLYSVMVATVGGTFLVLLVGAMVFIALMTFRTLGGRYSAKEHEGIAAATLFWDFTVVVFVAVWYFLFVLK
jgi:heme/copper-type cytochrome/quinol oxidase subunit 3